MKRPGKALWAVLGALPVIALTLFMMIEENDPDSIDDCVLRGLEHYKQAGAYPTLGDGRDATAVAQERCSQSRSAF